jgi:4-amino-4-deoxy-L-arabinose transferase-like glycosyltransferase
MLLAPATSMLSRIERPLARLSPWVSTLTVPVIFVVTMWLRDPSKGILELNGDEGINAIKALLTARGFANYSEIWNDQPPVLTYLLAGVFETFGFDVEVGRKLVLLLSGVLLWAGALGLRKVWGNGAALAGSTLVALLPQYSFLSMAVMVGLPAIALAVLAWAFLMVWWGDRRQRWLALSGVALALSAFTKGFTLLALPLMLGGLLIRRWARTGEGGRWWFPSAVWSLAFVLTALLLGLGLVGAGNLPALIAPHWIARQRPNLLSGSVTFSAMLIPNLPVLALALAGTTLAVRARRWWVLVLSGWSLAGILVLRNHQPLWYHHQLIITVPAALVAGVAVAEAFANLARLRNVTTARARLLTLAGPIVVVALVVVFLRGRPPDFELEVRWQKAGQGWDDLLLAEMKRRAPETHWVLTDRPIMAFQAGLPVPPSVAVITDKRMRTGLLREEDLINVLRVWKPEQVLLARFELPRLLRELQVHYRLVLSFPGRRLYWRQRG